MRIAISGTHGVGKTTLAEHLAGALPSYALNVEPYHMLDEDGHDFADPPTIEDFELQLERSIETVRDSEPNTLFDRCPLDILGYLTTHQDADSFDEGAWLPRVRKAMARIDLIVFVPIEAPDRVAVPRAEAAYREQIDEALRGIIVDDAYGVELEVLTVEGNERQRVDTVLARVRPKSK